MWILATWGAIMPSLRKNCPAGDDRVIQVRVRRMKDAVYFREHYLVTTIDAEAPIVTNAGTDYDARLYITPGSLADALAQMALDIDYASFKDQTTIKHKDEKLHTAYYAVWQVLYDKLSTRKAFSRRPSPTGRLTARQPKVQGYPHERIAETVYRTENREWRMKGASPESIANLMREIDAATAGVELPSDEELATVGRDEDARDYWFNQRADDAEFAARSGPTELNGHLDHSSCSHNSTAAARRKCRKRFYGRS